MNLGDDLIAKDSTMVTLSDGSRWPVHKGVHYRRTDPAVVARPDLFTDDDRYGLGFTGAAPADLAEPPVEQTTAAPGERRNVVRRG